VVARRRSSGVVSAWAEAQRRQQRQQEAEQRALLAAQREQERVQRAALRARAQHEREALLAYQRARESDAARQTQAVESRLAELAGLLHEVALLPPFHLEQLKLPPRVEPFNPGALGVPVIMPEPGAYQVAAPAGLRSLTPAARRDYQQACAQAQARFERDRQGAAFREQERQRQLGEYHRQYQVWLAGEQQVAAEHNAQIDALAARVAGGEPAAVREFFSAALTASPWPGEFPREGRVAWDPRAGQLMVDRQLPGLDVVPAVARYRYVKAGDRQIEIARPAGERATLYRQLLARCVLRVLAVAYQADRRGVIQLATVNGYVHGSDPATGQASEVFVVTLTAARPAFTALDLSRVDPVACLEGLGGQLSARPDKPASIQPGRLARPPAAAGSGQPSGGVPDLMAMDPIDFEDLVAALFQRMGLDVMTTERTGDGGVDVRATDPDPVRGGKLVIQVKRYQHTIPPAPVRDLYGTMLHEGAIKGILVTTAEFGPGAQQFAVGKPLTLIGGTQLTALLAEHGLQA
jgi:restriction system protein